MRLRSLATATVLAVAATPLLTGSATAADATIGGTLGAPYLPCQENTFLQTASPAGQSYAVPADGVITSYRFQISGTAPTGVALKVARGSGTGPFTITGSSAVSAPAAGESLMQRSVRIPAKAGDVIGVYAPGSSCAQFTDAGMFAIATINGNAAVGTVSSGSINGAVLNIAATVEPDADGDGFGDTTQDQCSTQATTQGACVVAPPRDTTAPDTTITSVKAGKAKVKTKVTASGKVKRQAKKAKATVTFTATEASTFACSVDGAAFTACRSPLVLTLKKGRHTVAVRATDAAGNVDPTPDTTTVTVRAKKAKKK